MLIGMSTVLKTPTNSQRSYLVDSNVWIAFYQEDDGTHQQAVRIIENIEKARAKIFLSNFIFQETWTLLRLSTQSEKAAKFSHVIAHTKQVQQFDIDHYWIEETIDFFDALKDRSRQSLTDFTNIFLALTFGFELVSFDKKMMNLYWRLQNKLNR